MKTLLVMLIALILTGCAGVQLPKTKGLIEYEQGKPKKVEYESTKAQAGFDATYNPTTGEIDVHSDKADSPRGYESYIQAQMQVELKRLELYQTMFEAAMKGAPGP